MANALYDLGREAFAAAGINWATDDIRAILLDTALYTVNLATDDFLSDIPAGARVGAAVALANKTNVGGICDADDVVFPGLVAAPTIEALAIYKHNASEAAARLIAYIDTGTGLPTPAGASQVTIVWANTTNKIFKL